MAIIEKDMHRAVYDKEINSLLDEAYSAAKAENPDILKLRKVSLKIGACDACKYIHEGFKAAALMGMEHKKNKAVNWHSVNDAPENISRKVLRDFLDVSLKFIELIDKNLEKSYLVLLNPHFFNFFLIFLHFFWSQIIKAPKY
jgi:hypothetical protein